MTTRDIGIVLHEELDRREKLIAQLTAEADGFRLVLGVLQRPTPEAHNRVTNVVKRGRKPKVTPAIEKQEEAATSGSCAKHPTAGVNAKGKCKACVAAYMRDWASKKKRGTSTESAEAPEDSGRLKSRCECGELFNDARSLGIHKTRVHYGDKSVVGSSLAGVR